MGSETNQFDVLTDADLETIDSLRKEIEQWKASSEYYENELELKAAATDSKIDSLNSSLKAVKKELSKQKKNFDHELAIKCKEIAEFKRQYESHQEQAVKLGQDVMELNKKLIDAENDNLTLKLENSALNTWAEEIKSLPKVKPDEDHLSTQQVKMFHVLETKFNLLQIEKDELAFDLEVANKLNSKLKLEIEQMKEAQANKNVISTAHESPNAFNKKCKKNIQINWYSFPAPVSPTMALRNGWTSKSVFDLLSAFYLRNQTRQDIHRVYERVLSFV
ncbi:hypothetical protein BC833DRAFT_567529 [Globomyces pollinis-pini]|nr:hypothetical protein BC833DRAFT_567529 [Globomyces pollinis-pini]